MERSIVIAGFGGQGILFAGHVLAEAANVDGLEVIWIPSYGPEMRGGTASCTVIVGDQPIGSPVVDRADGVIAMNPPSVSHFAPLVRPGGLLIVNASLGTTGSGRLDIRELAIDCSDLGGPGGDERLGSIIALGALVESLGLVQTAAIRVALEKIAGARHPEIVAADLLAFERGRCVVNPELAPA